MGNEANYVSKCVKVVGTHTRTHIRTFVGALRVEVEARKVKVKLDIFD